MAKPEGFSWASPYLIVSDVDKAIEFYKNAFGFELKDRATNDQGQAHHAEFTYKDQTLMIGQEGSFGGTSKTPANSGVDPGFNMYLYHDDVDALFKQATTAGAKTLHKPEDQFWGDRMCMVSDPDGHKWAFATQTADAQSQS